MMQLVTDHKLKSTSHRVIKYKNQEIKSRYSIPFFLHPRPEVFLDSERTLTADQFLNKRLQDIKLN
jgi:isopenicillin N synthase-like dioxygenase